MSYALRIDGLGWRAVTSQDEVDCTLERYEIEQPATILTQKADIHNAPIKAQLLVLDERLVRSLHEAILAMVANGVILPSDLLQRLQDIATQKQALRSQLQ